MVCHHIGAFYLAKHNDYDKAEDEIRRIGFTNVELIDNCASVKFTVARPGLFIGPMGRNVDELAKYLGKTIKIVEELNYFPDMIVPVDDEKYTQSMDDMDWGYSDLKQEEDSYSNRG